MADIAVETFDVDVGASGSTHTLTNDVGSTSSAFVKINNSTDKSSSGPTGSTANTAPNVAHVATRLTDTSELTFTRNSSTTVKVVGEVWRYTGSGGGANEFINRGTYAISVSGTSGSTAVSGIVDEDKCVPFLVGVDTSETSTSDYEQTTFAVHMDGSGNVVASRNNSGTAATVYVNVVEFTGSNWSVGHGVSSSHDASAETITLNTDSTGTGGSTFDVGDWETAFIEASTGGDTAETGLSDVMFAAYPAGTTTQVVFDMQFGDNNARNDATGYVHVVQNDDLIVKRDILRDITEGNGSYGTDLGFPTGTNTTRNLDELALEWFVDTSGTGTAHKRGSLGARITDATGTIRHWVHRTGNAVDVAYGVIDLSQLSDSGGGVTLAPDEITVATVQDSTTIEQDHKLTPQDISVATNIDQATINQVHILTPQGMTVSIDLGETTLSQDLGLDAQTITTDTTIDNTSITQDHKIDSNTLVVQTAQDNTTLAQIHLLNPNTLEVALTIDEASISLPSGPTTIAGDTIKLYPIMGDDNEGILIIYGQAHYKLGKYLMNIENNSDYWVLNTMFPVKLGGRPNLSETLIKKWLIENPKTTTINQSLSLSPQEMLVNLIMDNATVIDAGIYIDGQKIDLQSIIDSTTIEQIHIIAPDTINVTPELDEASLSQIHELTAQTLDIATLIDNGSLNQTHLLTGQKVELSQTMSSTALDQNHILIGDSLEIALTLDNTSLEQTHILQVNEMAVALTMDEASLGELAVIAPDGMSVGLTIDNGTISQVHNLSGQEMTVTSSMEATSISQTHFLPSQNISSSTSMDTASISQIHNFSPNTIETTTVLDNASITQDHKLTSGIMNITTNLDNASINQDHVLSTNEITISTTQDSTTISQTHILSPTGISVSTIQDSTTIDIPVPDNARITSTGNYRVTSTGDYRVTVPPPSTPSVRGSQISTSADSSAPYEMTVTLPTHQSGDELLIFVYFDKGSTTTSAPTGWTYVTDITTGALTWHTHQYLFKKTATSSSETNPTFTMNEAFQYSRYAAMAVVVQDTTGVDVHDTASDSSTSVTSFNAASITTTVDNTLVINSVSGKQDDDISAPNTLILESETPQPCFAASYFTQSSAGATGTQTFTSTAGLYRPVGISVALK